MVNAIRIKRGSYNSLQDLLALFEDFNLASYGNEMSEMAEIRQRLG
jgi:hypothetical protein